jgi:4-hydroxybenzoyl-CoA reductase subunit alpha
LGVDPSTLVFRENKIYGKGRPETTLLFADVVRETLHSEEGRCIMGRGFYNAPSPTGAAGVGTLSATPAFSFGAQVAEVEVDPETGTVALVKMTVAHDVGFAINPLAVEGQLDGQVFSGMGQVLSEECVAENGIVLNASLLDYKVPRPFEMPEIDNIIVETIDPHGPFGAKEAGEGPLMATAPAIAGAVSNALGFPITEIPIRPETVLRALRRRREEQPQAEDHLRSPHPGARARTVATSTKSSC